MTALQLVLKGDTRFPLKVRLGTTAYGHELAEAFTACTPD
jgi:hypothetical protein